MVTQHRSDAAGGPLRFDDASPWGRYRLHGAAARRLALCHAVPRVPGGRRVAMWLRHGLKHRLAGPVDAEAWGYRLRLMPRGNLSESRWLFLPRFADHAERALLRRALTPGGVFLDIGANAGFYSFWAARWVGPRGRVLAVEPDPEMQRRIRFNAGTNGVSAIELAPVALSDEPGEGRLRIGATNRGENTLTAGDLGAADGVGGGEGVGVEMLTLMGLCERHGIERIDALKIDIEGHEHRVMRRFFADAEPARLPRVIQFERCTAGQDAPMRALVEAQGYRPWGRGRMNAVYALGPRGSAPPPPPRAAAGGAR